MYFVLKEISVSLRLFFVDLYYNYANYKTSHAQLYNSSHAVLYNLISTCMWFSNFFNATVHIQFFVDLWSSIKLRTRNANHNIIL